MKVSLFIPCLVDNFEPRVGEATLRLLTHLGCEVSYPRAQTCCGQPFRNEGDEASARRLARRMTRVFRDAQWVVTPSPSCAAMVIRHYQGLVPDVRGCPPLWPRTRELCEFLVNVLGFDPAAHQCAWPGRVTLHRSCHGRELGPVDHAAGLLAAVQGLSLEPLADAGQCCGFGGLFAVRYPQISTAMAADKLSAIERTGADWVGCDDAGCSLQIRGAAHRRRTAAAARGAQLKHTVEILAESLGLLPRAPRLAAGAAS